jgi:hypothetical protein
MGTKQSAQTANYIEAHLRVLPEMAKEAQLETLSYLIDMAAIEATALVSIGKNRRIMKDDSY